MNLGSMLDDLYEVLGFAAAPPTAITTRLKRHINTAHREILGMHGMSALRRDVLPVSTISGVTQIVLPKAAVKVRALTNRTTGDNLREVSLSELRQGDPMQISQSTSPDQYAVVSYNSPTFRDPGGGSVVLAIISSDSGDSAITAYIEGSLAGYPRAISSTIGASGTVLSSYTGWDYISKFYLSAAPIGNVTLRLTTTAGTIISTIPIGSTYSRYTRLEVDPVPSAVFTLYADVDLYIADMTISTDEPMLPVDFHWIIYRRVLAEEHLRREKTDLYAVQRSMAEAGIKELKNFISGRVNSREYGEPRFSQLGPWFPPGS